MTEPNRKDNAATELVRAHECLREARLLLQDGLPYGATSRAYYAIFHAARALLFWAGLETRSHRGLVRLIGAHFVKPGLLRPELGRLVSRVQRDREDADYETGAVFTTDEASEAVEAAERFLDEARRLTGRT